MYQVTELDPWRAADVSRTVSSSSENVRHVNILIFLPKHGTDSWELDYRENIGREKTLLKFKYYLKFILETVQGQD